jgi:hypothetical protein
MQKWEYKDIIVKKRIDIEAVRWIPEDVLVEYGENGWELVSVVPQTLATMGKNLTPSREVKATSKELSTLWEGVDFSASLLYSFKRPLAE